MSNFFFGTVIALFIALFMEIIAIQMFWFGANKQLVMLYSGCGILVYGFYVIVDLYLIAKKLEIDDYILGALTLYLDLLTLFLHILRILGNKK